MLKERNKALERKKKITAHLDEILLLTHHPGTAAWPPLPASQFATFPRGWRSPYTGLYYRKVDSLISNCILGPPIIGKTPEFIIKDLNYITLSVVSKSVNLTFYFLLLGLSIFNLKVNCHGGISRFCRALFI